MNKSKEKTIRPFIINMLVNFSAIKYFHTEMKQLMLYCY